MQLLQSRALPLGYPAASGRVKAYPQTIVVQAGIDQSALRGGGLAGIAGRSGRDRGVVEKGGHRFHR